MKTSKPILGNALPDIHWNAWTTKVAITQIIANGFLGEIKPKTLVVRCGLRMKDEHRSQPIGPESVG